MAVPDYGLEFVLLHCIMLKLPSKLSKGSQKQKRERGGRGKIEHR